MDNSSENEFKEILMGKFCCSCGSQFYIFETACNECNQSYKAFLIRPYNIPLEFTFNTNKIILNFTSEHDIRCTCGKKNRIIRKRCPQCGGDYTNWKSLVNEKGIIITTKDNQTEIQFDVIHGIKYYNPPKNDLQIKKKNNKKKKKSKEVNLDLLDEDDKQESVLTSIAKASLVLGVGFLGYKAGGKIVKDLTDSNKRKKIKKEINNLANNKNLQENINAVFNDAKNNLNRNTNNKINSTTKNNNTNSNKKYVKLSDFMNKRVKDEVHYKENIYKENELHQRIVEENPDMIITQDGSYPGYYNQTRRVCIIGHEDRGMEGAHYNEVM